MILSDKTIRERISEGDIRVDPDPEEVQYQPMTLDLRLGDSYTNEQTDEVFENQHIIEFEPSVYHLAHTLENFSLPDDVCGFITGRSSLQRNGLFFLPIFIHPGFTGQITLQAVNMTDRPISLPPEQRVAQVMFMQLDQPVEQPYGEREDSKYQDQTGPTESRMDGMQDD